MKIDPIPMENAIVGFPLSHTLSPVFHNAVYKKMGIHAVLKPLPHQDIVEICKIIRDLPLHLVAVTIPYKQEIIKFLDEVDETAQKIGAVNTVLNRGGKLSGYNTDLVGIQKTFEGISLQGKNVLLIGAGGVARPVAFFVQQQGGHLFVMNRTFAHAKSLVKDFGGKIVSLADIHPNELDVIINTTPVGMHPHQSESPIPSEFFKPHHIVFDIVYNPLETLFLKEARESGAQTISGLKMFIAQGLEQIRLWTGQNPPSDDWETFLQKSLKSFNKLSPHSSLTSSKL